MSDTAAAQLRRLLHLIPLLADGEPRDVSEIARLAGTDRDTMFRDLFSLSQRFGDPGGFVPGLGVMLDGSRVTVRTSHFHRPMRLTAPELYALELGLAMIRRESPPDEQPAIDRARARLREALSTLHAKEAERDLRHAETAAAADPGHLRTLRTAVRQQRRTRILYCSAGASTASSRIVCPYALIASRGAWYLVAHCDDTRELRIFRLDRLEKVEPTPERFTIPASFSVQDVLASGKVFHAEEAGTLRVRYSPRIARWIAEREGVALAPDGSLTVDHPLADARWAVRHVLQYGPDAEVVAPPDLRDELAKTLRRLLEG